jgi:hypothetical protein
MGARGSRMLFAGDSLEKNMSTNCGGMLVSLIIE